jgi:hypothetical protein
VLSSTRARDDKKRFMAGPRAAGCGCPGPSVSNSRPLPASNSRPLPESLDTSGITSRPIIDSETLRSRCNSEDEVLAETIKIENYLPTSHPGQYACPGTSAEGGRDQPPPEGEHLKARLQKPLPASIGYGNAKANGGILHGGDDDQSAPPSENLKKTSVEAEASGSTQVRLGRASPPVPAPPWMQQPAGPEQSGFWSNARVEEINQKMWTEEERDEIIREAGESIFEQNKYGNFDGKR